MICRLRVCGIDKRNSSISLDEYSVMAGLHRAFGFERYPKYKTRFIKLCDDIMELRKRENLSNKYGFKNGTEYFNYWLYEELPKGESLFDMEAQR